MDKILRVMAMSVGSWLGWTIGAPLSIGAAVVLSAVGSGVGLYVIRQLAQNYF
jgi:hypothetical protein